MANTTRLKLPEIMESQASKYATHNESLVMLDALTMPCVESTTLTGPPAQPQEGECFIINTKTATGAWAGSGKEYNLVQWANNGWRYYPPERGWMVYDREYDDMFVYKGGLTLQLNMGWVPLNSNYVLELDANIELTNYPNARIFHTNPTTPNARTFTIDMNNSALKHGTTWEIINDTSDKAGTITISKIVGDPVDGNIFQEGGTINTSYTLAPGNSCKIIFLRGYNSADTKLYRISGNVTPV